MRSMVYSNTAKPLRPVCPKCSKKGINIWHAIDTFRSRQCRYCAWTEFNTFHFDGADWDNNGWRRTEADVERMHSYNGGDYGYVLD
jgi:hypothetical protein